MKLLSRLWAHYLNHVDQSVGIQGDSQKSAEQLWIKAARALTILRVLYVYALFLAYSKFGNASEAWIATRTPKPRLHLHLPALVPLEHWNTVALLSTSAVLVFSLMLAINPRVKAARVLVALGYVLFSAMSFDENGKTNHANHPAMWMMIAACFLPGGKDMGRNPRELLRSFFGMQLIIGMLYSCAGICKIIGFFCDLPGGITWFSPDALPLTISQNWSRSSETLLGGFFVLHPLLAMVGQAGALVLELFALPALLFRQLHRPWAVLLVLMHTMILASMRIHFHEMCFTLLLFIGVSPFATSLKLTLEWLVQLRPYNFVPSHTAHKKAPFSVIWPVILMAVYLPVAFSRFDSKRGEFQLEFYPVSAMPMFFRIHSSKDDIERLSKLRRKLDRDGLFPARNSASP